MQNHASKEASGGPWTKAETGNGDAGTGPLPLHYGKADCSRQAAEMPSHKGVKEGSVFPASLAQTPYP